MKKWIERTYAIAPRALQETLLDLQAARLARRRMGRDFDERLVRALESDRQSESNRDDGVRTALRAIVEHAGTAVPHYRELFERRGIAASSVRDVDDLERLPVLRRTDVQTLAGRLRADGLPRRHVHVESTTGTTGTPVHVLWDRDMARWNHLTHLRARAWAGYSRKERIASFLGHLVVPIEQTRPPYWRHARFARRTFHSSFHLDPERVQAHLDEIRRRGISWIEGYPSTAWLLALGLAETDRTLPLKGVFVSSEPLLDIQRSTIEKRFECRAWDAYSMSEGVVFAAECEQHDGLHVFTDYGVVEILDDEDRPVPPGAIGRIVATGLRNRAMPLIRYDTGDVGGWMTDPCPCGRTLPRLLPITTKAESYVVRPDGTALSPSILTHAFKPFPAIRESRIRQTRAEELTVSIVANRDFTSADVERLREGLASRVGPTISIAIERVESLPAERGGKRHWVTSTVPIRSGLSNIHTEV